MILPCLTVLSQSCRRRPIYMVRSSRHLLFCLPLVLLPFLGCYSVTLLVHLLSSLRIRWPAHLHLAALIFIMISFTWVCFLISVFLILSVIVMLSILLSIALCAVISFCSSCLVVVHVSAPYAIVGIYTLVKCSFLGTLVVCDHRVYLWICQKKLNPAFILIITSSRLWFSIITVWPRYLYLSTFSITSFSITIVSSDLKLVIYFVFPLCIMSPIFLLHWFSKLHLHIFSDVAIRAKSSTNLRSVKFSPSTLSPLSWRFSVLNISSTAVVNILGEIVSPCLTPFSMLIVF